MRAYRLLLVRDVQLAWHSLGATLNPMLFMTLVVLMFPLALGASPLLLAQIAPGVLWVAALLAVMLSVERLFRDDMHDGFLAQWWVRGRSLTGYVGVRLLSANLLLTLPMSLVIVPLAYALGLPMEAWGVLLVSVGLGVGCLIHVGAIGSALTTSLPRAGLLQALLVLPFYIPVLIFAASAVSVSASGLSAAGQLYVLAALWVLSVVLAPIAIAAALKLGLEQS